MIDADDVQLQIKKKARRRLVGAVAFAALAALVLPMVMDQEPKPPAQEVEIHIPGQDGKPFQPSLAAVPVPQEVPPPSAPVVAPSPVPVPVTAPQADSPAAPPARPVAQVIETVPSRAEPRSEAPRPAAKPEVKPAVKPETKPAAKPEPAKVDNDEAKRAAAILAGHETAAEPAGKGPHVVLIGAFANEANVQNIKSKLGELGIKVYTEPLDSPQGKKTRVRAGPFPSREAAEKALEKMKRIGVSGVVSAK